MNIFQSLHRTKRKTTFIILKALEPIETLVLIGMSFPSGTLQSETHGILGVMTGLEFDPRS